MCECRQKQIICREIQLNSSYENITMQCSKITTLNFMQRLKLSCKAVNLCQIAASYKTREYKLNKYWIRACNTSPDSNLGSSYHPIQTTQLLYKLHDPLYASENIKACLSKHKNFPSRLTLFHWKHLRFMYLCDIKYSQTRDTFFLSLFFLSWGIMYG